jgi:GNAT superfamily N-acetyltransferase
MSNALRIRRCEISDLEVLVKMRVEFLKEAEHVKDGTNVKELTLELAEYIKSHINKDLFFWVAEIEEIAVSTGALSFWEKLPIYAGKQNGSKIGYISNMYTVPEYRRKGIASDILEEIIKFGKEIGMLKIMLHALEDGKGVYKSLGFSISESFMEMKL